MLKFVSMLAAAIAVAGAAAAGPSLSQLFPHYQTYLETPAAERSHFSLVYRMTASDGVAPQLRFDHGGETHAIALDEAGKVLFFPDLGMLKDDPEVEVLNRTEGRKFSLNLTLVPVLPAGEQIALAEVKRAVDQANAAIRSQAGVLSFAVPKMNGVAIVMPEGADAPALSSGEALKRDPETGAYRLELKAAKQADAVSFPAPPASLAFID